MRRWYQRNWGWLLLDVALWAWLLAVVAAMHLLLFPAILEWDSNIFLLMGKWLPRGIVPYRDALEVKPPGIFLYLGGLFAVLPDAMWVVRFADVAWTVVGVWALVRLLVPTAGRFATAVAATAWIVWHHHRWFNPGGVYTEQYAAVAGLAALACRRPIASGAWVAVATLFKHPGVAVVVPIVILRARRLHPRSDAAQLRPPPPGWSGRDWLWFALAAALPIAAVMLWFAAVGAWDEFLHGNLWVLYQHGKFQRFDAQQRWMDLLANGWKSATEFPVIPIAAGLGIAAALRTVAPLPIAAAGWWLVSMAGVALQANFFNHHFTLVLPAVVLLGGSGLGWLIRQRPTDRIGTRALRAALLIGVAWWSWAVARATLDRQRETLALNYALLRDGPAAWPRGPAREFEEKAGLFVRERSTQADRMHVQGWNALGPAIYWYADRLPAVTNFYQIPFVLNPRRQLRDLQAARPLYIVFANVEYNSPVRAWVEQHYRLEHSSMADYTVEIWRRVQD